MRPGGAVIELQPFGFDAGPAHLQYPLFNLEVGGWVGRWVGGQVGAARLKRPNLR